MGKTILITGGTGLIGSCLTKILQEKGYTVNYLSRKGREGGAIRYYQWDLSRKTIDPEAIRTADYIIHLAGENVAGGRLTEERKQQILASRTESTQLLKKSLLEIPNQVQAFVAATAIGLYGDTGENWVDETWQAGRGFLADVCVEWEQAVDKLAAETKLRTVKIRVGVVLAKEGGALPQMSLPVKLFAGAPLGSGQQYVSWVHIHDLCQMFVYALENAGLQGAFNGVAPHPVTNAELTQAIAKQLHRPVWPIHVPGAAMKIVLGDMADVVLTGSRITPQKIVDLGFAFQYPALEKALAHLLAD